MRARKHVQAGVVCVRARSQIREKGGRGGGKGGGLQSERASEREKREDSEQGQHQAACLFPPVRTGNTATLLYDNQPEPGQKERE
jgi:hypothetical protein